MISRNARFVQANIDYGGVPNGRETWFDPNAILVLVLELLQLVLGPANQRMVIRIAKRFECDERVEHRGKDSRQTIRPFEPFNHPLFGFSQGAFAEWVNAAFGEPFRKFMEPVQAQKEVAPGQSLGGGRECEIAFVNAFGIKFVEANVVFKPARRLEVVNYRERDEHRTAPGAHLVKIYIEPFSQQNDFAWNRRNIIPRENGSM